MLLMLAVDNETTITLVTDQVLDELNVSFDDALGLAVAHLNELGNHNFGQVQDGTFISSCGDFYDASRVLIPELIEQLPLKGNPVAIVFSRSVVLISGSEDQQGLEKIAQIALDEFPDDERAISLTPIELRDGRWQPLAITEQHPIALRNLVPNQIAWTYAATAPALQKILGDNVFVASAQLIEVEGRFATIASWAANVPTACPLVEAVVIQADESFSQVTRRLEEVLSVCGPFDDVEIMAYPKRWLLPGRMSVEQRTVLTEQYPNHVFFGKPG